MVKLTVDLPFPEAALNPNRRHDRRALTGSRQRLKMAWWALTLQRLGRDWVPPAGDVPMTLHFAYAGKVWDCDNSLAAVKAGLDGVAAAMKINDSRFNPLTIVRTHGHDRPAVYLTLEV